MTKIDLSDTAFHGTRLNALHAWISLALPILLSAFAFAQETPTTGERAVEPMAKEAPLPVPDPNLEGLDPAVAEQLRDARKTLLESLQVQGTQVVDLAENYGLMGELYHAYRIGGAAETCYRNALSLVPNSFRWTYLLAHLKAQDGDSEEAVKLYQKAVGLEPTNLPAQVALGNLLLQQGNLPEARAHFLAALRENRNSAAASFGLGQVSLSLKEYADAVGLFQKTLALAPDATAVHYPLALAYRALKRTDEANRQLSLQGPVGVAAPDPLLAELEAHKQGEVVLLLRGKTAYQARRFKEAAELFLKAAQADPRSARARINAGAALAAMGDTAGAEERIREALEVDPENVTANFNLAVLLRNKGENRKAIEILEKVVDKAPGDEAAHLELARSYLANGDASLAKTLFEATLKINRANEDARLGYVQILLNDKEYAEAKHRLTEEHKQYPSDGRTAFALAKLLAASPDATLRDGKTALELALKVFDARNTVGHARTVAEAYAELGDCKKAAEWIESTLKAVNGAEGLDPSIADRLRADLIRYRQGPPCRPPFDPER